MSTFDFNLNAIKYGMKVNEDRKDAISAALVKQLNRHGKAYCPCSVLKNEDTLCPCKEMREEKNCHCGLYVKE